MSGKTWTVDADDFSEQNLINLDFLLKKKQQTPNFRITLFTIPALCSEKFLIAMRNRFDWIDLVPHGWAHPHPYECSDWDYGKMLWYVQVVERDYPQLTHGFKAPGWQISNDCYFALADKGWWVADQSYNDSRRPANLPCYIIDKPEKVHLHVGAWNGTMMPNSLSLVEVQRAVTDLEGDFTFVKDVLCPGST